MPDRTHIEMASMTDPAPTVLELPRSDLTPAALAAREAPRLCQALRAASGPIRRSLGTMRWLLVAPALKLLEHPQVMAIVARVLIEIAVVYFGWPSKPLLDAALPLLAHLLKDERSRKLLADVLALLELEPEDISEPARDAVIALDETRSRPTVQELDEQLNNPERATP